MACLRCWVRGIVPVTLSGFSIDSIKQLLDLRVREGRDNFPGWSWNFHTVKRVVLYDILRDEPREENSQAAQVAIYAMSRETPVLGVVKAMSGETPLLLQIEDELSDFMLADLRYVYSSPFVNQEVLKVAHAVGDDGNGIRAFAFGGDTKLITMKQSPDIGARI